MASTFSQTFRCVSTTPLGVEVDPDVNWTKAMSSSEGAVSGSVPGASSASRKRTNESAQQVARSDSKWGASAAVVTTALALAPRRVLAVNSKYLGRSLVGDGG